MTHLTTTRHAARRRIGWSVILLLLGGPLFGQSRTQDFTLQPGWNSVLVEVEPEPNRCDEVFRDLPIDTVWNWNERETTAQFDPDGAPLSPQPRWLLWMPPTSASRLAMNLFTLRGGRTYLIKVSGDREQTLRLSGRPVAPVNRWSSAAFALAGFEVDDLSPPTFDDFLTPSGAHGGQPVYRIDTAGRPVRVDRGDRMRSGEAVYVFSSKPSTYSGPLEIEAGQGRVIDFGRSVVEQILWIRNQASTERTVTIRRQPAVEPEGGEIVLAGQVPLSYFALTGNPRDDGWRSFPSSLDQTIPADGVLQLRISVRRRDMPPFRGEPGTEGVYQTVLEISDGGGFRTNVPVTALRRVPPSREGGDANVAAVAGLWVGMVRIDRVSQASSNSTNALPTDSRFQFRLLLHVDNEGMAKLLREAILLRKDATTTEPARLVLLTDDSLLPEYGGSALRDGRPVGRRFSTPIFGFDEPIDASADESRGFADELVFDVEMPHDHRLNPFVHRYHPDHDNLDARFENTLEAGRESFTIRRAITLEFDNGADPDRLEISGLGDQHFGGVYKETITGVHRSAIRVEGIFRLHRAADVGLLNDGR